MAPPAPRPRPSRRAVERFLLGSLAVLLVAAVCADDPYEPDDTRQTAKPINPGETQSRRLCDPDWASFTVQHDSVYAIEASSPARGSEATLELWECFRGSDAYCSYGRTLVDYYGGNGGASRTVRRFSTRRRQVYDPEPEPQTSYVAVLPRGPVAPESPSYDLGLSCLSGCGGYGTVHVLPIAATGPGLVTDLVLGNPGLTPRDVELVFSRTTLPGAARPERLWKRIALPGGATVRYEDVVWTLFDVWEGGGAVEIRPLGGDILATAVLRDPRSGTSRGELFAPVRLPEAVARDVTSYLLLLGTQDGASARLALYEPTGGTARAVLRVFSGKEGTVLSTTELSLSPHEHLDLDLERDLGIEPAVDVYAAVQVVRGHLVAASLVSDRASGDVFAQLGQTAGATLALPTRSGTHRTEVSILAVEGSSGKATVTFSAGVVSMPVEERRLEAGRTWYLEDPLRDVADGTDGYLRFSGGVIATARALSRDARGSLGGSCPNLHAPELPTETTRFVFLVPPGTGSAVLGVDENRIASLVDEKGLYLGSERGTSPLWQREPSSTPLRIDVEGRWYAVAVVRPHALLFGPQTHDLAYAVGQPLSRTLDRLTLSVPGPDGPIPFALRRIPPGDFSMGSPEAERGRDGDEVPHDVSIRRPLFLAETEVTLSLWQAVTGRTPADLPPAYASTSSGSLPVANVSWDEVAGPGGFFETLTRLLADQRIAATFRLPTEAEWEYTARAGSAAAYGVYLGDLPACDLACVPCTWSTSIEYCATADASGPRAPSPYNPNGFGLRHTAGGVWEWVADWYAPYETVPSTDPAGPPAGQSRVVRGGGWRSELRLCRAANRYAYPPSERHDQVGFRIALSLGDR